MGQPTPAIVPRQSNSALWSGTLLVVLGIVSNFFVFWHIPGQTVWPWVSLLLPAVGLVFLLVGLKRAFSQPQIFRGKISGSIIAVVSALLFALTVIFFVHVRALPASAHAPKIGDKAPDFSLADTNGQTVTLSQLLSTPIAGNSAKAPKAVLLVFYRGWW